ncbi:hypothetical protein Vau01_066300 [Virgisporangium aurantiacum]|uniref:Uncharacterized protein n=2 Tax=Virgisporangium aurantiacum TaxID=175570 RepID=A0A8J3Z852_9ACTN|nr:hypothetical protein Vau01_066300 [Virgisporangium aurantiacum]
MTPLPQSRGRVSLAIHNVVTAFFSGTPDQLPTPPNYPLDAAQGHCDDWSEWLTGTDGIYLFDPSVGLTLEAGSDDLVVIKRVDVEVFRRVSAGSGTIIKCLYGGGSNLGYSITVDTLKTETRFEAFDSDETGRMPPASISLGNAGSESADIGISSPPGNLYEGSIKVSVIINNKPDVITIGTAQRPFRWHSGLVSGADPDGPKYDWHPLQERWVRDFDPFSVR